MNIDSTKDNLTKKEIEFKLINDNKLHINKINIKINNENNISQDNKNYNLKNKQN